MFEFEDRLALAQMRVREHLGRIEHGTAHNAAAGKRFHDLALLAPRRPALDLRGQCRAILGARRRCRKALVGAQIRALHYLGHGLEHFRVIGRDRDVDVVVRPVPRAAQQVGPAAGGRAVAGAVERRSVRQTLRVFDPGQVQHRLLHRDLDELAAAGVVALYQGGEDRDRQMHAGAGIADIGAVDHRRTARLAGDAHRTGCRLRHRLEAFELAVGTVGTEPLDRSIDHARIQRLDGLVTEAQPVHDTRSEVLGDDVGVFDQPAGDLLALLGPQIDDGAALVAVEQQEVKAVEVRIVGIPQPPRPVAMGRALDLDHIGTEPCQHLGARGTRLVVREIDDADAFESLTHLGPPSFLGGAVDRLVDPGEQVRGQRAGFGRGDAFGQFAAILDAKPIGARRRHHRARFRRSIEKLQRAGRVEQIGDALHRRWSGAFAEQPDDRVRMPDPGQTPGADQALSDELFEDGSDIGDKGLVERHAAGGVGPARDVLRIGHDIRMKEEQVEPRQAQPLEAAFDRSPQCGLDLGARRIAEAALAGDPHPCRQPAIKGLADDLLRLAVAITRGEVDQVDTSGDRVVHRGDAFVERRLAPHHPEPAAAQSQRRDRPESAEAVLLHQLLPHQSPRSRPRSNQRGLRLARSPYPMFSTKFDRRGRLQADAAIVHPKEINLSHRPNGPYWYWKGVNPVAVIWTALGFLAYMFVIPAEWIRVVALVATGAGYWATMQLLS